MEEQGAGAGEGVGEEDGLLLWSKQRRRVLWIPSLRPKHIYQIQLKMLKHNSNQTFEVSCFFRFYPVATRFDYVLALHVIVWLSVD